MTIPKMHEIAKILFDEEECIRFLIEVGIICEIDKCPKCESSCSRFGKMFHCTRYSCKKAFSIFKNTFFSGSRLKCNEVMHLAYLWLTECSTKTIRLHVPHGEHTVRNYQQFFRQLVTEMIDTDDMIIGGPDIVVQIDETKIGKRKYHRGHRVEGAWVIVGVEKTEKRLVFAEVVKNRNQETIEDVISRHVCDSSIIWTDKWKGYTSLSKKFNIRHEIVNHSKTFKDPISGVNTNTVEGTNFAIKRKIPLRNRNQKDIPELLLEFIWRRKNSKHLWDSFISALKKVGYDMY